MSNLSDNKINALHHRNNEPATQPSFEQNPATPIATFTNDSMQIVDTLLIGQSNNGFGLVKGTSHPIATTDDGDAWVVYRQAPEDNVANSEYLRATYAHIDDQIINEIITYTDINANMSHPRTPNALATENGYLYTLWDENTSEGNNDSIGRPFYSYTLTDTNITEPIDIIPAWEINNTLDLWNGSAATTEYSKQTHINISFDDQLTGNKFLYHGIQNEEGTIQFDNPSQIFADFPINLNETNYTSATEIDCNTSGTCVAVITASDPNDLANHHPVIIFSGDGGETWNDYVTIPEEAYRDFFPASFTNPCNVTEEDYTISNLFFTYDFAIKVTEDKLHFIGGITAAVEENIYPYAFTNAEPNINAIYHLSAPLNGLTDASASDWQISEIIDMTHTWAFNDPGGNPLWQETFPNLAVSKENPDHLYMMMSAVNMGMTTDTEVSICDSNIVNNSTIQTLYPNWNMDIYASYSTDAGLHWSNPSNLTNTPDIHETYVHTAKYVVDDTVTGIYQTPDITDGATTENIGFPDLAQNIYLMSVAVPTESSCDNLGYDNITHTEYLSGNEWAAVKTFHASGLLTDIDLTLEWEHFYDDASWAADLIVIIQNGSGQCVEFGGYDVSYGSDSNSCLFAGYLWPAAWDSSSVDVTYTASIDLSPYNLSHEGEWKILFMNGFSNSQGVSYNAEIVLNGLCAITTLVGDFNEDGAVDVIDIIILTAGILEDECPLNSDFNADNICNVMDIIHLVNNILDSDDNDDIFL